MERRFEIPMLVAALLVIPVIAIEVSSLGQPWDTIAGVANWGIWLAFLLELVVMLGVVPSRGRWLREHPLDCAPGLLPGGSTVRRPPRGSRGRVRRRRLRPDRERPP